MSTTTKVLVGATPVIVVLVAAAFFTPPDFPHFARQLLLFGWSIAGIFAAEWLLFGRGTARSIRAMGFAAPRWRAVVVALIVSVPMWLFLPVFAVTSGVPVTANSEWITILLGVILVNGLAEEVIHRAFVFGHLRREHPFIVAAAASAAVFGAQHLYLTISLGPVAGSASVLLALLLAFPLAFLYERGGDSLVGPVILHTSSNAPMMIFANTELAAVALLPHMAVVLVSIYLSFAFARWLDPTARPERAPRR